jgi:hypothetical protein
MGLEKFRGKKKTEDNYINLDIYLSKMRVAKEIIKFKVKLFFDTSKVEDE